MAVRGAKQGGIDIKAAAGHNQCIDMVEIIEGGVGLMRQQHRQTAGVTHRVAIILADCVPGKFRPAARGFMIEGEADNRLGHGAFVSSSECLSIGAVVK